jgi:hypothetical protein
MFASGPMGLTVLCLFQAGGAQIEAGARVETMAGEMPSGTSGTSATSVMFVATPSLRLDWFAGVDLLQADLSTRILWRPVPSRLRRDRPLFLETLGLTHSVRPTLRSQWRFDLRASYGEQDYTSLSQQFATQPKLPPPSTMFMIDGAAEALWRSSRRTTLAIRFGASHRRSWTDQGSADQPVGVSLLPAQTMVTASPEMRFALSRRVSASLSVPTSAYHVQETGGTQGRTMVYSVQPQIGLMGSLSRSQRLRVVAGLTYASLTSGTTAGFGNSVTPLALIGLDSDLYKRRIATVRSFVNASTSWYVDPVVGQGIWRGIAQAGIDSLVGPRWSAGQSISFTADLSQPASSNPESDGTVVSAGVYVRYRWTDVFVVELGGRYSERGPRLASSDFSWRARELWGFLTLYTASRMNLTNVRPIRSLSGSGI